MTAWTEADQAELDLLLYELATGFAEHRKRCEACQPCPEPQRWRDHKAECPSCSDRAPLTYGRGCERREAFRAHVAECKRCAGPCPHVQNAVAIVVDWRERRQLVSRAAHLRAERDALEAA